MNKIQGFTVAGKAWVALFGSVLTFVIPWIVEQSVSWPQPYPALVGMIVALLTAVGVYHAPYQPVTPKPSTGTPTEPTSTIDPWPVA